METRVAQVHTRWGETGTLVRVLLAIVTLAGVAAGPSSASTAKAAGRSGRCGGWTIVPVPAIHARFQELRGVAAVSANDVWAVGEIKQAVPLAEHWDGLAWREVAVQRSGQGRAILESVGASSSDDAWAVGWSSDGTTNSTLVEHWDGSAWSIVPSPSPDPSLSMLLDVVTVPGTDRAWAVGMTSSRTLVERSTGSAWSVVRSPSPSDRASLQQASADSATDAWATGFTQGGDRPLTLHWDGAAWTSITGPGAAVIQGLDPSDALAAGISPTEHFERWNGSTWSVLGDPVGFVRDIEATTSNGWSVGYTFDLTAYRTYAARWDGASWATVPTPNAAGTSFDLLISVALVPGTGQAWAVGVSAPDRRGQPETVLTMTSC